MPNFTRSCLWLLLPLLAAVNPAPAQVLTPSQLEYLRRQVMVSWNGRVPGAWITPGSLTYDRLGFVVVTNEVDPVASALVAALTPRVSAVEAADVTQDSRLSTVEATNTAQNTRLTAVEGTNLTQNTRLDAVENTNLTQNSRLTALEPFAAGVSNSAGFFQSTWQLPSWVLHASVTNVVLPVCSTVQIHSPWSTVYDKWGSMGTNYWVHFPTNAPAGWYEYVVRVVPENGSPSVGQDLILARVWTSTPAAAPDLWSSTGRTRSIAPTHFHEFDWFDPAGLGAYYMILKFWNDGPVPTTNKVELTIFWRGK